MSHPPGGFRTLSLGGSLFDSSIVWDLWTGLSGSINLISIVIYAALGLVALLAGTLILLARGRRRRLEQVTDHIQQQQESLTRETVDEIATSLPDGMFRAQLREFSEAFVKHENVYYNTHQSDAFIKDEAALQDIGFWKFRYPQLRSLPGAATGLGILGTFLGIALGLGLLSQNVGEVNQLSDSIGAVIAKLSLAFWTSIVGVILAIIIGFFANGSESRLLEAVDRFREALDRKAERITPEGLLDKIHNYIKNQTAFTGDLLQQTTSQNVLMERSTDAVAKLVEQQTQLLAREDEKLPLFKSQHAALLALKQQTHELRSAVSDRAMTQWEQQTAALEQIKEENTESRALIQTMANDLAEQIGKRIGQYMAPQMTQMTDVLRKQVESTTASSTESARRFADEAVQQMTTALQEGISEMGSQVAAASAQIADAGSSMGQIVQSAGSAIEQQQALLDQGSQAVSAAQQQAAQSAARVRDVTRVADKLSEMIDELRRGQQQAGALHQQQSELQQQAQQKLGQLVEGVGEVTATYTDAAEKMRSTFEGLERQLGRVQQSVDELQGESHQAAVTLKEAVEGLNSRVAAEETLVDKYRDTAGEFSKAFEAGAPVVSQLTAVSAAVREALQHLKQGQSTIENLQVAQSELTEQSAKQVSGVVDGIEEVTASYAVTAARLGEVLQALDGRLTGLTGSVERLGQQTTTAGTTIEAAASQMKERVAAEEQLLTRYRETTSTLETALGRGATALEGITSAADSLSTSVASQERERAAINELQQHLSEAGQQIAAASEGTVEGVSRANQALQSASARMADSIEESTDNMSSAMARTEDWAAGVNRELQQFSQAMVDTVKRSLVQYDESLGNAVRHLASSVKELEDVADEMASAAEDRRVQEGGLHG